MCHCDNWAIRNAEQEKKCCLQFVVIEDTTGTNPILIDEEKSDCLFDVLIMKLNIQCFGHIMQRQDSIGKKTDA